MRSSRILLFSAPDSCLLLMLLQALLLYYILLIKRQKSEELFVYVLFVLLHMSMAQFFAQLLQVNSNLEEVCFI